jgi:hypothetical protein
MTTPERLEEIRRTHPCHRKDEPTWVCRTCELLAALDEQNAELEAYKPCSAHGVSDLPSVDDEAVCWLCLVTDYVKENARARAVIKAARTAEEHHRCRGCQSCASLTQYDQAVATALKRYDSGADE